jgi:hypothetical protein
MADPIDCALVALQVYSADAVNMGPLPQGWDEVLFQPRTPSSFQARAYRNRATAKW